MGLTADPCGPLLDSFKVQKIERTAIFDARLAASARRFAMPLAARGWSPPLPQPSGPHAAHGERQAMPLLAAKPITASGDPFTARHHARMFLLCLSYATLCFFNVWSELADRGYDFLSKYTVTW